jgi:glutamate N-acetyltransferase/amino-acid N-acetyltransferase
VSVTAPEGYRAGGISAGFKASGRPDLAVLVSEGPAVAAALFTTNAFAAAPVALGKEHLAVTGGVIEAVAVNSGQANAGTGADGLADAREQAGIVAAALDTTPERILVSSTGVIGPRVPLDVYGEGVPLAVSDASPDGGTRFAQAILTTDRSPKQAVAHGLGFTVGGCVKGAGMIAPDLATLLCFITTDARVSSTLLPAVMREHVAPVWNGLSVDGCASTNDTVLLMANGAAGSGPISDTGPKADAFAEAVRAVCEDLAKQVVLDAEGSTHGIVVLADGAASQDDAARAAKAVAESLLVKTAVFGGDPNPGRILQAVGASGAKLSTDLFAASIGPVPVIDGGVVLGFDVRAAEEALKEQQVVIRVRLGDGLGVATAFGCDLGYEYVRINAEYTT